jgi:hypothetical protein
VSDFIQRYLKADQRVDWDTLKAELAKRFADISDAQNAFMLLRQVKQGRNENVQIYAERLLSLAEQAYDGTLRCKSHRRTASRVLYGRPIFRYTKIKGHEG